jgi:hypothetical protein
MVCLLPSWVQVQSILPQRYDDSQQHCELFRCHFDCDLDNCIAFPLSFRSWFGQLSRRILWIFPTPSPQHSSAAIIPFTCLWESPFFSWALLVGWCDSSSRVVWGLPLHGLGIASYRFLPVLESVHLLVHGFRELSRKPIHEAHASRAVWPAPQVFLFSVLSTTFRSIKGYRDWLPFRLGWWKPVFRSEATSSCTGGCLFKEEERCLLDAEGEDIDRLVVAHFRKNGSNGWSACMARWVRK